MDEKHPNRKKDKHNPYTLMIVEGRYYLFATMSSDELKIFLKAQDVL